MTNAIQNSNLPFHYSPSTTAVMSGNGRERFSQTSSLYNESRISITTDDGDVVTISGYQQQSSSLSFDTLSTPFKEGVNFTMSSLSSDSFNLSLQGDLDEEELADIENLLEDLSAIAGNFFSGDLSSAQDGALNLAIGSLAELSATFTHSSQYATKWSGSQLAENHPLPQSDNFMRSVEEVFSDLPEIVDQIHTDEMKYAEMLKAQWQQIKDFLEQRETPSDPIPDFASSAEENDMPIARRMMSRFQEIASKHPRLAPLGPPLAREVIDNKLEELDHPAYFKQKNQLKENFLNEFNNWMYT